MLLLDGPQRAQEGLLKLVQSFEAGKHQKWANPMGQLLVMSTQTEGAFTVHFSFFSSIFSLSCWDLHGGEPSSSQPSWKVTGGRRPLANSLTAFLRGPGQAQEGVRGFFQGFSQRENWDGGREVRRGPCLGFIRNARSEFGWLPFQASCLSFPTCVWRLVLSQGSLVANTEDRGVHREAFRKTQSLSQGRAEIPYF